MTTVRRILEFHSDAFAALDISEARGTEGIFLPFRFELRLGYRAAEHPNVEDLLRAPAWLGIRLPAETGSGTVVEKFHGDLTSFERIGMSEDFVLCRAVLESPVSRLNLTHKTRTITATTVDKVLLDLLKEHDIPEAAIDRTRVKKTYPDQECITQERETNLTFFHRLMEHWGLFYFHDLGDPEKSKIALADDWTLFPNAAKELAYLPARGTADTAFDPEGPERCHSLTCRTHVQSDQVVLTDYNWRQTQYLRASYPENPKGKRIVHLPAEHFKTEAEGKWLAQIRYEGLRTEEVVFHGSSNARRLRAGTFLKIKDWFDSDSPELRILQVDHDGWQSTEFAPRINQECHYENTFTANPKAAPFREYPRTAKPIALPSYGFVDVGEQYAGPEDVGLYPIRDPNYEDQSAREKGQATRLLRRMHPNAGPRGSGDNRPLHFQTEVLKIPVFGDPDRPVIAGALYNSTYADVVTGSNAQQSIRRTAGGIQEIMDDTDGTLFYSLEIPTHKTHFSLGALHHSIPCPDGVVLGTQRGVSINAGEAISIAAGSANHDEGINNGSAKVDQAAKTSSKIATVLGTIFSVAADVVASGPFGALPGAVADIGGLVQSWSGKQSIFVSSPQKIAAVADKEIVVAAGWTIDCTSIGATNILSVFGTMVGSVNTVSAVAGRHVEIVSGFGDVKVEAKFKGNVVVEAKKNVLVEAKTEDIRMAAHKNVRVENQGDYFHLLAKNQFLIKTTEWPSQLCSDPKAKKLNITAGKSGTSSITMEDDRIIIEADTVVVRSKASGAEAGLMVGKEAKDKGAANFFGHSKGRLVVTSDKESEISSTDTVVVRGKSEIAVSTSKLNEKNATKIERANSEEG